jgi:hypothetical protein
VHKIKEKEHTTTYTHITTTFPYTYYHILPAYKTFPYYKQGCMHAGVTGLIAVLPDYCRSTTADCTNNTQPSLIHVTR